MGEKEHYGPDDTKSIADTVRSYGEAHFRYSDSNDTVVFVTILSLMDGAVMGSIPYDRKPVETNYLVSIQYVGSDFFYLHKNRVVYSDSLPDRLNLSPTQSIWIANLLNGISQYL